MVEHLLERRADVVDVRLGEAGVERRAVISLLVQALRHRAEASAPAHVALVAGAVERDEPRRSVAGLEVQRASLALRKRDALGAHRLDDALARHAGWPPRRSAGRKVVDVAGARGRAGTVRP